VNVDEKNESFWIKKEPWYLTTRLSDLIHVRDEARDQQLWDLLSLIQIRAQAEWTAEGIMTSLSFEEMGLQPEGFPQSLFELRDSKAGEKWMFLPCSEKAGKMSGLPVDRLSVRKCEEAIEKSLWPKKLLGSKWEAFFLAGCLR
jgi:hypothetical protein